MTLSDIQNKIYFYTKTNASSFTNADMLIAINVALNRVSSLILSADERWEFDDTNQTDLPIATTNLVSGQQDYSLAAAHLTIDRLEVLQPNGTTWSLLDPIDQQDLKRGQRTALAQYFPTAGTPIQYDLIGNSFFLYPKPNYSVSAGLKVYFTRGPIEFSSSDLSTGTAAPGFNSLFHELIPLWVGYDYAIANSLPSASGYFAAIQMKEQAIKDFYGNRNRDSRPRFTISGSGQTGSMSGQITTTGGDSNK
jgi:hypothetical protein